MQQTWSMSSIPSSKVQVHVVAVRLEGAEYPAFKYSLQYLASACTVLVAIYGYSRLKVHQTPHMAFPKLARHLRAAPRFVVVHDGILLQTVVLQIFYDFFFFNRGLTAIKKIAVGRCWALRQMPSVYSFSEMAWVIIVYYSHYRHKFGSTFFHFSFFADTNPKRGFAAYKSIF
mgnify:CR=1 FL=1